MIIEQVDIEDFRSHKKSRITFNEGISVIVGENGSGKTSILDAVNYALFKQKPNKDINADDLIRRGREEAIVSVRFHQNGRVYKVKRARKKGRATGSMFYQIIDGKEIVKVKGEGEITREVEDVLGMTGELFGKAIYIKQGELDSLISATPSSRKEIVGKLLGAHDLETSHKNMWEIIKEYEMKAVTLTSVSEELEKTIRHISEKHEELNLLGSELKTITEVLVSKTKEIEEKEREVMQIEALKELETKKREKALELSHIQEKIRRIEEYENTLKETIPAAKRYAELENEVRLLGEDKNRLTKFRERETNLKRELDTISRRCEILEGSIAQAFERYGLFFETSIEDFQTLETFRKTALKDLESKEKTIGEEKERLLYRLSGLKSQNQETKKALDELKGVTNKCPVCKKPLTEEHKKGLMEEYTSRIESNAVEIRKIESKIKEIEHDEKETNALLKNTRSINLEVVENRIKEQDDARSLYEKLKAEFDENIKDLAGLADLEKRLLKKETEKQGLVHENERHIEARGFLRKNLPEKHQFMERTNTCIEEIEKIKEEVGKKLLKVSLEPFDLQSIPQLLTKARLELKKQMEELQHLGEKKTKSEYGIQMDKQAVEDLNNELVELKEKEKEKQKLEKFVVFLKKIRNLFHKDRLQKELRINSKPIVERYTREVFDRFDLPYSDIELTDDFGMVVFCADGEESVDMLSGGEKIAAALALRIGIARAISGPSMELIILDEPTIHLDSQRRLELVEIIKKLFTIPQTIVVTHDKEFENAADVLITVEKVGGISKVRYEGE